jgi:hypothetical protein
VKAPTGRGWGGAHCHMGSAHKDLSTISAALVQASDSWWRPTLWASGKITRDLFLCHGSSLRNHPIGDTKFGIWANRLLWLPTGTDKKPANLTYTSRSKRRISHLFVRWSILLNGLGGNLSPSCCPFYPSTLSSYSWIRSVTHQSTMQDGWYVDRKHFFIVFLSSIQPLCLALYWPSTCIYQCCKCIWFWALQSKVQGQVYGIWTQAHIFLLELDIGTSLLLDPDLNQNHEKVFLKKEASFLNMWVDFFWNVDKWAQL